MHTLKKAIPTTAGREAILGVILNPMRLPEWSLLIKAVQHKKDGYVAQTLNGLIEFFWFVDRGHDRAIMQFDCDGRPAEAVFFLYEQDGLNYVGEEFPVDDAHSGELKRMIRMVGKELARLRGLVEREDRAHPAEGRSPASKADVAR